MPEEVQPNADAPEQEEVQQATPVPEEVRQVAPLQDGQEKYSDESKPTPATNSYSEKPNTKIESKPSPLNNEQKKYREEQLNKIGFHKNLTTFKKHAESLNKRGFKEALTEATELQTRLQMAAEKFTSGNLSKEQFIDRCQGALDKKYTSELTKHRGVLGFVQKIIQAVRSSFTIQTASQKTVKEIKKSLHEIKMTDELTGELLKDDTTRRNTPGR